MPLNTVTDISVKGAFILEGQCVYSGCLDVA